LIDKVPEDAVKIGFIRDQFENKKAFRRSVIYCSLGLFSFTIIKGMDYMILPEVMAQDFTKTIALLGVFTVPTATLIRFLMKDYSESSKK